MESVASWADFLEGIRPRAAKAGRWRWVDGRRGEDGDRDRGGGGRVVGRRIHPWVGCSRGGVIALAHVRGRFVG